MTDEDYYSRNAAEFIDGSPIFKTQADEDSEDTVAKIIESEWGCMYRS